MVALHHLTYFQKYFEQFSVDYSECYPISSKVNEIYDWFVQQVLVFWDCHSGPSSIHYGFFNEKNQIGKIGVNAIKEERDLNNWFKEKELKDLKSIQLDLFWELGRMMEERAKSLLILKYCAEKYCIDNSDQYYFEKIRVWLLSKRFTYMGRKFQTWDPAEWEHTDYVSGKKVSMFHLLVERWLIYAKIFQQIRIKLGDNNPINIHYATEEEWIKKYGGSINDFYQENKRDFDMWKTDPNDRLKVKQWDLWEWFIGSQATTKIRDEEIRLFLLKFGEIEYF